MNNQTDQGNTSDSSAQAGTEVFTVDDGQQNAGEGQQSQLQEGQSAGAEGQQGAGGVKGQQSIDQGQQNQQAAPSPIGLTPEQLQQLITGVGQTFQQNAPQNQQGGQQQQRQYTAEEFNRAMNVYQPTRAQLLAIRNAENEQEALEALNDIAQGAARQAVTMAQYGIQALKQEFQQMLSPLQQHYAQVQQEQLKGEFYKLNPDLQPFEPYVSALIDQMKAKGMRFPNKEAAFKVAADEARKQLKAIPGINFGQATQTQNNGSGQQGQKLPGQQSSQQQSRMSTLSGGGQGGVGSTLKGGQGNQKVKGPPGIEVF